MRPTAAAKTRQRTAGRGRQMRGRKRPARNGRGRPKPGRHRRRDHAETGPLRAVEKPTAGQCPTRGQRGRRARKRAAKARTRARLLRERPARCSDVTTHRAESAETSKPHGRTREGNGGCDETWTKYGQIFGGRKTGAGQPQAPAAAGSPLPPRAHCQAAPRTAGAARKPNRGSHGQLARQRHAAAQAAQGRPKNARALAGAEARPPRRPTGAARDAARSGQERRAPHEGRRQQKVSRRLAVLAPPSARGTRDPDGDEGRLAERRKGEKGATQAGERRRRVTLSVDRQRLNHTGKAGARGHPRPETARCAGAGNRAGEGEARRAKIAGPQDRAEGPAAGGGAEEHRRGN